jgi:hypothetical protein
MTILCNSGLGWPLWRAKASIRASVRASSVQASIQAWAFERLISLDWAFGDLRWAIVALLSRSLAAASNHLVENILRRAWQGARFAHRVSAAATMVAAGGR